MVSSPQIRAKISFEEDWIPGSIRGSHYMAGKRKLGLNARVIAPPERLREEIEKVLRKGLERTSTQVNDQATTYFVPGRDVPQYSMIKFANSNLSLD